MNFRLISVFLLSLFILFRTTAQEQTIRINFILNSPDLSPDTAVFIAGGHEQLGNWNPGKIKMNYSGNHTWTYQITLNRPLSIEYKYTLGSWEREAANANGSALANFNAKITKDTTIKNDIYFWTKGGAKRTIESHVTGKVAYHKAMKGTGINDRDIIVWFPPGYETEKTKRYPVLYMHDGQNIFDPATSAFGVDWKIDETFDSLIRKKFIPPMIVVGIYNTPDRTREYGQGEKGKAYMEFMVRKLKPFIDSAYRTKRDAKSTWVGGSSMGGLISFMLAWEYPKVFSKAICMSPAFKISSIDYVKVVNQSTRKSNGQSFYIDNGGVGLESQLQPGIDEMIKALKAKGFRQNKDYFLIIDPEAKHFESAWAERFPEALLMLYLAN